MISSAVLPAPSAPAARNPRVDIVIPVYNEQAGLERSVSRLHAFLSDNLPFAWRIVIADNASADARCARRGAAATRTSSATWTSTSPPTCVHCCRWSPA
jgi:hypothetical protein